MAIAVAESSFGSLLCRKCGTVSNNIHRYKDAGL